jgi:ABC-2 type transport system ATP-binding protein
MGHVESSTDLAAPPAPVSTPAPAVELCGVRKRFGGVQALDGLDMTIPSSAITVLLGPNGAGKTTAIRSITGALPVDEGTVRTFGLDPTVEGESVRRRCGVVSAKPALYDRMTGWDNLAYAAALYGVEGDVAARIRAAAARFGIEHALDQQVGGFSTGMKTRLALSRALLNSPDLLLLDEPTSGLDPESSHAVLALIREMTREGITAVMCTHLLVEAEGLADQIVMLDDGINLLSGTQEELIGTYWPEPIVRFEAENPDALDALATMPHVRGYRRDRQITAEIPADRVADTVAALVVAGVRLTRIEPHRPSLEELYFRVRREHRERRVTQPPPPDLATAGGHR